MPLQVLLLKIYEIEVNGLYSQNIYLDPARARLDRFKNYYKLSIRNLFENGE